MFHLPNGPELIIIVVLILVLFGGKKIPEFAKGLGSGIKNFKNALNEPEEAAKVEEVKKTEELHKVEEVKTTAVKNS